MIKIRETRKSDYKEIYQILRKTKLASKWFTQQLFSKLLRANRGFYFVAIENGRVVGSIFSTHDGGYYGYVYKLAVDPSRQGRGIATKLVAKAIAALHKKGVGWIFGHTLKNNKASLKTLSKFGFAIRKTHVLIDKYDRK